MTPHLSTGSSFSFLAHFSKFVRPGAVRLGTAEAALPDAVSAVVIEEVAVGGG